MFHISSKGDYGLLLLSALAQEANEGRTFVSLRKIAEAKKLPLKYLAEIAVELKKAGFVVSKEGRDGGYSLARPANKITLMEVLEILEGPVEPLKCCSASQSECARDTSCGVKSTWKEATNMMREFLKNKTLADTIH